MYLHHFLSSCSSPSFFFVLRFSASQCLAVHCPCSSIFLYFCFWRLVSRKLFMFCFFLLLHRLCSWCDPLLPILLVSPMDYSLVRVSYLSLVYVGLIPRIVFTTNLNALHVLPTMLGYFRCPSFTTAHY